MMSSWAVSKGFSTVEERGREVAVSSALPVDPRRKALERVFNAQLSRLMGLGYPEAMGISHGAFAERFAPLHRAIDPARADRKTIGGLLVVVPDGMVSIRRQMELLRSGRREGHTGMDGAKIVREPAFAPTEPYLAYGFDWGHFLPAFTASQAMRQIEKQGKLLPVTEEAIAFALHYSDFFDPSAKIEMPNERYNGGFAVLLGRGSGEHRDQLQLACMPNSPSDRRDWRPWTVSARTFAASSQTND